MKRGSRLKYIKVSEDGEENLGKLKRKQQNMLLLS